MFERHPLARPCECVPRLIFMDLRTCPTLELTAAELFEITRRVASLPGGWSAVDQCTHDGHCYAGLIDPDGDGRVAVIIARDRDGLYVARALWPEAAPALRRHLRPFV
jgi:hypothetical protein